MFGLFGKNPQRNPKAWLLNVDSKQLNKAIDQVATHQMLSGQEPDPWALLGSLSDEELWQCVGQVVRSNKYQHPMLSQFHLPEDSDLPSLFSSASVDDVQLIDAELDPAIEVLPDSRVKHFDWSNVHRHAHTAIIGATGDGKTTLATWLASQLQGDRLVIDPHYAAGDWKGIYVVGAGRNFVAAAETMQACLKEMDRRYTSRLQGKTSFTNLTLIVEEIGSIAEEPDSSDICKVFLPKVLREARKVGIKLILLGHGLEVESLGVKGKGSIRNCLNTIRLGQFAIDQAKLTKDPSVIAAIEHMDRPCMVDRRPALVPDLSGFKLPPGDRMAPSFLGQSSPRSPVIDAVVEDANGADCLAAASTLSEPLQKLVEYCHKRSGWTKASQVKSGIRLFRDSPTDEIRNYFAYLVDRGIGQLSHDGNEYRCVCDY
jgi:hypothetical protein